MQECSEQQRNSPQLPVRLVHGDLDGTALLELAARVDCVVNSANNHLLTPFCTGIAGALLAAGGPELQKASDEAKAAAGGTVALGEAVWTHGGRLKCGIAHAVALTYRPRVLATPESVRRAFASALQVAGARQCRTAVAKLMCARPGYSTVPADEAPTVMLNAMLAGVEDFTNSSDASNLEEVLIFVPISLLRAIPTECERPSVLWSDKAIGCKAPAFERLQVCGVEVLWRENVDNDVVVEEALQENVSIVITNQKRLTNDGDQAGLMLCSSLMRRSFRGRCIVYSSHLNPRALAEFWLAGACFATDSLSDLEAFLKASVHDRSRQ